MADIAERLQGAFDSLGQRANSEPAGSPHVDPVLRPSTRPGVDIQANGAIALARRLGRAPGEVATEIASAAAEDLEGICSSVEAQPQGFINLTLDDDFISCRTAQQIADTRLGVPAPAPRKKVVVDYSGPNVAKEMHVGHLRSTIIGDALCRMLTFAGHEVIRENHVGDWGTSFGMLIEHLVDIGEQEAAHELEVGDLDSFYRQARQAFEADPSFRERSRRRVVLLQSGDAETRRLWKLLVDESIAYFDEVYSKLGVLLTRDDVVGESFYNDQLPDVLHDLESAGLLVESDGARCVFLDGYTTRDGTPLPLIVQKSDGGFGYAATDLATLRDRFGRLGADLALYVVGAPQAQHLAMCFEVAAKVGWLTSRNAAVHVPNGSVLGSDGKMLRTRSGESVKLVDLLDEAVDRASRIIEHRALAAAERRTIARMVGIGAVKYADLSTDRTRDYVLDWERMLSFDGNTAPYLQYARVRCMSIFRRGGIELLAPGTAPSALHLATDAERSLAIALLGFADALEQTLATWSPHRLCSYLYHLASAFTDFFESVPVLNAEDAPKRASRLALTAHTATVLQTGLGLLGIECPERM
jgi:arginyl-tRNA synthetase